jgi:hypothetical protein
MAEQSNVGKQVSQQPAWYDDQPFGIGDRVEVTRDLGGEADAGERGRVVGYDASGPRLGEPSVRVLVVLDRPMPGIIALPREALIRERADSGRESIATAILVEMEQTWPPTKLARLLVWLQGEQCAALLAQPDLATKNIMVGGVKLPGFVLPELVRVAAERHPPA